MKNDFSNLKTTYLALQNFLELLNHTTLIKVKFFYKVTVIKSHTPDFA